MPTQNYPSARRPVDRRPFSICAVLPAYNEQALIEHSVRHVAEVIHLLAAMDDQTDLVIGFRAKRADPPMRLLNAWGWKHLVNGLFGYTARDVDCAFKLFRREVWRSMTVESRGATFSAEFLIKARRLGFRISELPVTHLPRTAGAPTGAHPRVIARAFIELFRLRMRLNSQLTRDAHGRALAGVSRDTSPARVG